MDKTPVYKESFQYAYQHGEQEQHRASNRPCCGGPAIILISSPAASTRRGASMTPTWRICGKARSGCGMRRRKY